MKEQDGRCDRWDLVIASDRSDFLAMVDEAKVEFFGYDSKRYLHKHNISHESKEHNSYGEARW